MRESLDVESVIGNENYIEYILGYLGKSNFKSNNPKEVSIFFISENYAGLYLRKDFVEDWMDIDEVKNVLSRYISEEDLESIQFISFSRVYTLQDISAIVASEVEKVQIDLPLNLTGKGVIVGIIDTGIDYLNEEFMDEEGNTRILAIWDQTIRGSNSKENTIPFGKLYRKEEINKAIEAKRKGEDPYSIVLTRDEVGHGTNMAGIIGASGKNKELKGVAPNCEFIIVKIAPYKFLEKNLASIISVYGDLSIMFAIEFLNTMLIMSKKPLSILLPLGSTGGNHKGDGIFNNYLENISTNLGIVIVTGAGNQAASQGHVSGVIKNKEQVETIALLTVENQKNMILEIWIDLPNIVEISVISPTGQESGFIPSVLNANKKYKFIKEDTSVYIHYYLPEDYTGEELILMNFNDISPGVWLLKLRLRQGVMANYNGWILQSGIALPGTKVLPNDPYGTITTPGDSNYVITVASYDQNKNSLVPYSSLAFREEYISSIDFAAGGVNTKTVGLNNKIDVVNGTSVSAAIGVGACALLFEWGIVKGNYPYMYVQSMKTFLRRGVNNRYYDVYPNAFWGYGMLNLYKVFENMTQ